MLVLQAAFLYHCAPVCDTPFKEAGIGQTHTLLRRKFQRAGSGTDLRLSYEGNYCPRLFSAGSYSSAV